MEHRYVFEIDIVFATGSVQFRLVNPAPLWLCSFHWGASAPVRLSHFTVQVSLVTWRWTLDSWSCQHITIC